MLSLIKQHLPICSTQWQFVAEEHSKAFPQQGRDENSIRLKFHKLCKQKMGTGNLPIPKNVKEALSIQKMINQHVDASTLDELSIPGSVGDDAPRVPRNRMGTPQNSEERSTGFLQSSGSGGAPVVSRMRSTPRAGRYG
jgi:hypothetical protein